MKTYLLIFNVGQLDPEIMRRKFAAMPELVDWLWFFGNAAVVKSFTTTTSLGQALNSHFPGLQFMVSEVSPFSVEGWMPQVVWDFVNNSVPQKIAS